MIKKSKNAPIPPTGSKPPLPDLVDTLIEIARHQEMIIAEIGKAIAKGDKDHVFELAKRLSEQADDTPGKIGQITTSSTIKR